MPKIQRVLLSVTDKTGITDFARALAAQGCELISTGGTAKTLRNAGLPVRDVSEVTGFPEMLDGRVKTMHPKITGGILAIRDKADHVEALVRHGILPIDMVVVNLYQFEKIAAKADATVAELIENIDIGGPTMIRSAAKNFKHVAVVVSPDEYASLAEELAHNSGSVSEETCWRLARKAFATTAAYDRAITAKLAEMDSDAAWLDIHEPRTMNLRYGENPHQAGAFFGTMGATQLQGKELSYNNLVDLDAAWQLILEFDSPASAIIKHTNPCGCAEGATLAESYRKAFECDPVSAFGGVLAFNRVLDEETAREVAKTFIEAIAAPDYSPEALAVLASKKNLRLMKITSGPPTIIVKSVLGGYLTQSPDLHRLTRADCQVKTKRQPTGSEWNALEFGWKVAKHVKSNAIVYARAGQIVGVGAGQMSRVDSVKTGASKAVLPRGGTVVASDAFFPFPDGVEEAARHGITAVIQPGGSVRDEEVIAAADRLDLAMVFTGVRHFRH